MQVTHDTTYDGGPVYQFRSDDYLYFSVYSFLFPSSFLDLAFSSICPVLHIKSAMVLGLWHLSLSEKYYYAPTYDRSAKKENGQSPNCVHA